MKPETVRKKWIAALRSGKYEQGRDQLRSGKEYCCLGVLCDLAVKNRVISRFIGKDELLPRKVQKWAALSTDDGAYFTTYFTGSLTGLNDDGESFKEIADVIERKPKGLFNGTK